MKNKFAAALLAFFAGAFGLHKFYLGENFAGILYLIFCWTFIPSVLAFFDFLGLIFMSESAFNARYNYMFAPSMPGSDRESSKNKVAVLEGLKKLYDTGVITAEEYEQKRRKYLDDL